MLLVPIDFMGHRYTGDTDDPEIVNINRKKPSNEEPLSETDTAQNLPLSLCTKPIANLTFTAKSRENVTRQLLLYLLKLAADNAWKINFISNANISMLI